MTDGERLHLRVSDTHSIHVPMNRVHLDDLRIDGDVWTYTLRIGQPEPLAEETP